MPDLTTTPSATIGIGLLFDMRNPEPWRQPSDALYGRTLDRISDAESLGIASVWLSEHHFFPDAYLPQPLTFAAAIAARTSQVRIGTAIMNGALHHPMEIAEQAAIVDIVSGGRLELGLGAGYAADEFEAFGADHSRRRGRLRSTVKALPDLWRSRVTPRPIQEDIPLWVAAMGPQMATFVGETGLGLLLADDEIVDTYRTALADPRTARCTDMAGFLLADDPEEVWATLRPHMEWIARSYASAGVNDASQTNLQIDVEQLRHREGMPPKPLVDVVTPEDALRRLRPWATSRPLAHIQFLADFAGLPDHLIDRHIELLATHVVGAFPSTIGTEPPPGPTA